MAAVKVSGTGNFLFPKDVGPGTGVFVWIIFLSLILAVLFLLDILTTQLILGMGGVELNPVMAGVVTIPLLHIILKIGIILLVVPVALIAEARIKGSATALYAALIIMYAIVVLNNTSILLPHIIISFAG